MTQAAAAWSTQGWTPGCFSFPWTWGCIFPPGFPMFTSLAQFILPSTPLTPLLCPPAPPAPLLGCSFSSAWALQGHQLLQGVGFQLLSWQAVCEQVQVPGFILICTLNSFVCFFPLLQTPAGRAVLAARAWLREKLSIPVGQSPGSLCQAQGSSCSLLSRAHRHKALFQPAWLSSRTSVPSWECSQVCAFPFRCSKRPNCGRKNSACAPSLGLFQTSL